MTAVRATHTPNAAARAAQPDISRSWPLAAPALRSTSSVSSAAGHTRSRSPTSPTCSRPTARMLASARLFACRRKQAGAVRINVFFLCLVCSLPDVPDLLCGAPKSWGGIFFSGKGKGRRVRPADKPSGCRLLLGPPNSWSWWGRSGAGNSGHPSRWGGRRFRTTGQRWFDTIFRGWYYFFLLPAAAIGDNQCGKIYEI